MADQYQVIRRTMSSRAVLPLTPAEFREIAKAIDCQLRLIDVEEAYDILVANYMDYEKAVASILIEEEVRQRLTNDAFNRDRRHMSRMTANLLSSARFFMDLTEISVPKLLGRPALKAFRAERARLTQASFHYRFMEELRNHSQHEHFAVTSLSYGANWLENGDDVKGTRVHTFKPSVTPRQLQGFNRFQDLLTEYQAMRASDPALPEKFDLTLYVRSYVMSLGDTLLYVRKQLSERGLLAAWSEVVDRWVRRFIEADGNPVVVGISAEELDDGQVLNERHLGGELGDVIARLQRENRKLVNLHRIEFRI